MLKILPAHEIIKTITDNNIEGTAADIRRNAFEKANELKSILDSEIIIEGQLYDKVEHRLNDDQKIIFTTGCIIDNSGKGATMGGISLDINSAINYIADRETKLDYVIVLTENCEQYNKTTHPKKLVIKPLDFISKMTKFMNLYESSLEYLKLNPQIREFEIQILEGLLTSVFFEKTSCKK
ncbi:MAG: hypothetical protein KKB25_01345 [Nanoarchaeota archaeon]|nr:hypothetical protein [Nanoarchaeota archaeon]